MIKVTDLQGRDHYVNAELIELIEANPDTQIVLTNGHRCFVRESPYEVAERVLDYRRACLAPKETKVSSREPIGDGCDLFPRPVA